MLNEERRRAILDAVNHNGTVLVRDLAQRFGTSQITIRKDLEVLHSQGRVHRTHGGALTVESGAILDPTLRDKEKLHRKEKARIAEAAARMVEEGHSILLDSGTTTTAIARSLRRPMDTTAVGRSNRSSNFFSGRRQRAEGNCSGVRGTAW